MRHLKILFFCLLSQFVNAQQKTITGKIQDTSTNGNISNGLITIFQAKDSALVGFSRIKNDGSFVLDKPTTGKYCVLISHPKYADFIDTVNIDENTNSLGNFYIISKKRVLEQVIVRAKVAPIRIKGDTIIYTADSFKVKDGANVEDLLKKLPGIQVGRNGEITAMGETVKKVLVDGEEFFGSDPGIVTKNLQANAVDKVEVFDKKSDQAAFTGIDDGVKDKTINLKLKDNKKNGYFGKLEASGGTPDNYDLQAMINAFKKKRKLAAFAMSGNVGNTSLDWQDNQNFGGSEGMEFGSDEGGGMWASSNGDEFSNFWGGRNGIPRNWNGGLHYSNKLNNDKHTVNIGYRYNKVNSIAESNTFSKTFLPDSSWNDNSGSTSFNSSNRNKINGTFETKLDSFNIIKFSFSASEKSRNSNTANFSESFSSVNPINNSKRNTTVNNKGNDLDATLLWMHRFKKQNRTLSATIGTKYNTNESDGFLFSVNTFYKSGALLKRDTIDQQKINNTNNTNLNSRISYTEPLSKKWTAELSYALNYNVNENNRNSYDRAIDGKYTSLALAFSNNFSFKNTTHTPGISFKYSHKKLKFGIGSRLGLNTFDQTNLTTNANSLYKFTNIFPNASFNLKLKGNSGINLNYNGNGNAPSLQQLQPIQDNNNPLFIVVGNPDLKQSFTHNFFGNYNMWNVLKQKSIWSYFNFSTQQNAFTSFSVIDTLGRRISKTVNVDGNYNANLSFNYRFKIKKIGLDIGVGPELGANRMNDFVNGLKNVSTTRRYGVNVNTSKWKEDKNGETLYGFWTNWNFTQNNNKASINQSSAANFRMLNGNFDGEARIFKKIFFNAGLNYELRQKDPRFPRNNNFAQLNLGLRRDIVKKIFSMAFEVKDVLNQNRGFTRSFNSYNYTESFYNTLRRYWLLRLTYKFNSQKIKTNEK